VLKKEVSKNGNSNYFKKYFFVFNVLVFNNLLYYVCLRHMFISKILLVMDIKSLNYILHLFMQISIR